MWIGEDVVDAGSQRATQMLRKDGFRLFRLCGIAGALRFLLFARTLRRLPVGDHGRERIRQRGRLLHKSWICHMPRTLLWRESLRLARVGHDVDRDRLATAVATGKQNVRLA